jgi:hypothetical protein
LGTTSQPRACLISSRRLAVATASMVQRADVAERARELLAEAGIAVRAVRAAEVPAREFRVQTDMAGRSLRQAAIQQRIADIAQPMG